MNSLEALVSSLPDAGPLAEDLAIAGVAARLGGIETLAYYRQVSLAVDEAADGPVTAADRASHRVIVEFLQRLHPQDPIRSEEARHDEPLGAPPRGRLWVVDPLDGTREFIDGIGEFSVMVGLAVDGRAVLGAVYRPDPGVLYLGVSDRAAWRIEDSDRTIQPLRISEVAGDGLRFVRSRSHPDPKLQDLERALEPTEVLVSGSVGVKCAIIAEGRADLYVHPVPYLKEWDTCAPEAVLRGAGGRVADCSGRKLEYGKDRPSQPNGMLGCTQAAWKKVATTILPSAGYCSDPQGRPSRK